MMIPVAQFDID